jgi:PST family polysaccharide transporter
VITKTIIKILPKSIRNKIESNQELRKIIGNINWLGFENFFQYALALFVGVWVARYLGPENFGTLNYVMAFLALFGPFYKLGLDQIIVRNLVQQKPEEKEETLGTALSMKFLGSIVLILASFGVILILNPDNESLKWFILLVSFSYLFRNFEVIDLYFQSVVQSKYGVIAKIGAFSVSAIIKIVLILLNAPLFYFVLALFIEGVLIGLGYLTVYLYQFKREIFNWKFSKFTAFKLLKDSWPLFFSSIAVIVYMKIDQIMIGEMLGTRELGIYSVAVRISEMWYFIPIIITSSVFPSILYAKKRSEKLYMKRLQLLYGGFIWFTVAFSLLVTVLSSYIIFILYGPEYSEAASVLSVHIWAGIFVFLGVVNGKYIISENLTKISFYVTGIGTTVNIILNIVLIPRYGIMGAAISTLISYSVATLSVGFFSQSRKLLLVILNSLNIIKILKK